MRIDQNGVEHPTHNDECSGPGLDHIKNCDECLQTFNYAKIKRAFGEIMSDEFETKKKFTSEQDGRCVEDDLMFLHQLDEKISELLAQRAERVDMIKKQNATNQEKLNVSEDWFYGSVRGSNDVACVEAPMLSRERPNGY